MDKEIISVVLSMGYKKMSEDIYSKPVGYSLYVVNFRLNTICQLIPLMDHIVRKYNSNPINDLNPTELLYAIKEFENWSNYKSYIPDEERATFHFNSMNDIEEMLDL